MTALDTNAPTIENAKNALRQHAERIASDPRTNSVFAYAQDLFRALESDQLTLADLAVYAMFQCFRDADLSATLLDQYPAVPTWMARVEAATSSPA